ncbi:hypothetical protein AYM40_09850 [Paraburkholderia phytofirmans OLGA172]|uniref:Uncharacterized protein n=1 Tax=Paraburkholderia phytofirmans OLGA172 TaxID=1417228 RepID=A0A161HYD7_9BURK|nr:hypothetical protein [Paraburkholderia phytofirmans]ANB72637.1 hypothetical protein AYM40_09850 [Paraburkholderia phytofirmans OLGA172]
MDQFDDEYECFTCKRRFRAALFSISREWDRVHYHEGETEVEISGSEGLECYCSQVCGTARRALVMAREGVPIRRPGLGPIEPCSKCAAPVDMAEFHLTYLESFDVHESSLVVRTVTVDYLAVLCRKCRPPQSGEASLEYTVAHHEIAEPNASASTPLLSNINT